MMPSTDELHAELERVKQLLGANTGIDYRSPEQIAQAEQDAADAEAAEQAEKDATAAALARAENLGVDVNSVEGSGVEGRVLVADVEQAAP